MNSQTGHRDWNGSWVPDPESHINGLVAPAIRTTTATLPAFAIEAARELLSTLQVCAFLRTALTGSNNDMDFVAKTPGSGGLAITIAIVVSGNNTPLSVAVASNAVTINSATNGSGTAISTANDVIAAVRLSAAASALVSVALAPANDGSGAVVALTATNLGDVSGTSPTIDVKLQTTIDPTAAAGWYDVPNASFTQAATVGSEGKTFVGLGLFGRWVVTIGGTGSPKAAVGIAAQFRHA